MAASFPETTLVLLGHGSTQNEHSARPVYQHAATLRDQSRFAAVRGAFWKQEPNVVDVLAAIATPRIVIVPLFISEGHFTDEIIPAALGFKKPGEATWARTWVQGERRITFTRPVGVHPAMTRVILHRAQQVVEQHPFPRLPAPHSMALFIAGHGTERNSRSRESIERQVGLIRGLNLYAEVQSCFLEESPLIAEVPQSAGKRNVVVVPFFISDGLHVIEDIPVLLGEPQHLVRGRLAAGQPTWRNPTQRGDRLIWYSAAVGSDPEISQVILELAEESTRLET